ncbi:MAG: efflux RND transporter periplasmic adaptor subunit [Isosphaeraceae bacterium]
MATDQMAVESKPVERHGHQPAPAPQRGGSGFGRVFFTLLVIAAVAGGAYYFFVGREHSAGPEHHASGGHEASKKLGSRLEYVEPRRGGMEMVTSQPGSVFAFEYAKLFAKVSGYVEVLNVDRGSRVKKGDLLIKLYVPELVAAVEQASASLNRARAAVDQALAAVTSAEEMINAKIANEHEKVTIQRATTARREYREKQYVRIEQLVKAGSVEQRLLDEEEDRRAAAREDEQAAIAGVETAKAELAEARAMLAKARADLEGARAQVKVNEANLDEQKTWLAYSEIHSPYQGVVIFRGEAVHIGAFIQSADKGMSEPMLTVARDDTMRTVIPVPDRDVPFCDLGDEANIRVDALSDREFKGTVSRIAESEDINDRTMRVEVDLPNPTHILRDGMYGRGTIVLQKATPHLTVPSSALLSRDSEGKGTLEVIRDGKMYHQDVVIGRDNGTLAEIVKGLDPKAWVVVKPDLSLADGSPVEAQAGVFPGDEAIAEKKENSKESEEKAGTPKGHEEKAETSHAAPHT